MSEPSRGKRPHPALVLIAILPALLAIGVFIFVARYEIAHDDARCPFQEVRSAQVAGATVREDSRRCLDDVEEHRWVVLREGFAETEIGRYPLEAAHFDEGFPWEVRAEEGRAVVAVTNPGRGEMIFREPIPDGGMR